MKYLLPLFFLALSLTSLAQKGKTPAAPSGLYAFDAVTNGGETRSLSAYRGKVVLLVNVASRCGYTPQYARLQQLHEKYAKRGLVILAFPSNDFGAQEPGTDAEIRSFCTTTYGVTFDLFSKIRVTGEDMHPLYRYLTKESPYPGEVKWNFTKFLADRKGTVVGRYGSAVDPMGSEITEKIESLLGK